MKSKNFVFGFVFSTLALVAFVYGVNAAEPNITLESGQVPTYDGIKQEWFGNRPGVNVPVHLSFTAPWDLTKGPKAIKSAWTLVETATAFDGNKFPDATFAVERIEGGQKYYRFYKKIANGLYWLGSSTPTSNSDIANFSFAPAVRLVLLPAKTGRTLVQNSNLVSGAGNLPVKIKVTIIGKGTAIVGAGTFSDAVMVQQKVELTGKQPYIMYQWYAPFVGLVAEIRSLDGETKELFTTASEFEWMKSHTMP